MPRILIDNSPPQFVFQDGNQLTDGMANLANSLVQAPIQAAQIRQGRDQLTLQNVWHQAEMDRQQRLDEQNALWHQQGQGRQQQEDAINNAFRFGAVPDHQSPLQPTAQEQTLWDAAQVGKEDRSARNNWMQSRANAQNARASAFGNGMTNGQNPRLMTDNKLADIHHQAMQYATTKDLMGKTNFDQDKYDEYIDQLPPQLKSRFQQATGGGGQPSPATSAAPAQPDLNNIVGALGALFAPQVDPNPQHGAPVRPAAQAGDPVAVTGPGVPAAAQGGPMDISALRIPGMRSYPQSSAPAQPAGPAPKHSLKLAMQLPFNQGKTPDQVQADLVAHGYQVVP